MNLLERIKIKGEIFAEYAYLTFELGFKDTGGGFAAEYIFRLPGGACVSNMRIVDADGRVVSARIAAASHISRVCEKRCTACLRKTNDDTYILRIDELKGPCRVIISLYTAAESPLGIRRLSIPLAAASAAEREVERTADINILARGAEDITCPTHNIECLKVSDGILISAHEIAADRDFCIEYSDVSAENSAIAATDGICGEMLCRIFPGRRFFAEKKDRVLFILDESGSLTGAALSAAREFICFAAAHCKSFAVVGAGESLRWVTDGFGEFDETSDRLYAGLSSITLGGSLTKLIPRIKEEISADILPVLVSGSELTEGSLAVEAAAKLLSKSGLCTVTFGACDACGTAAELAEVCGGSCVNVYGGENIENAAERIMRRFLNALRGDIEIIAGSGSITVKQPCAEGDSAAAVVTFSGDYPPYELDVKCGKIKETVRLPRPAIYKSFSPIGLLCASALSAELSEQLISCDPDRAQEIKLEIEKIGVKYSALNSETAYIAELGGDICGVIGAVVPQSGMLFPEVFEGRVSMFREDDEKNDKLVGMCSRMLIGCMRSDGAICAPGELNCDRRLLQTLIAYLALTVSGEIRIGGDFERAAMSYIDDREIYGLKFTRDKKCAAEMLKKFFGDDMTVIDKTPDFYTAARLLADLSE